MNRDTPAVPLVERLSWRLFGTPFINNVWRGELVEEIVAMALEPNWKHCGGDYAGCDLIHPSTGRRIQVKQAAARQSWGISLAAPRFSIAHKTGEWIDGARWVPGRSRNADIFIFAWHSGTDESADHRDPSQWRFHVVREADLPHQKSLGLTTIEELASKGLSSECDWNDLRLAVEKLELP